MALEHNGELYSSDQFVDEDHLLGSIEGRTLREPVTSPQQWGFLGDAKLDGLPDYCEVSRRARAR